MTKYRGKPSIQSYITTSVVSMRHWSRKLISAALLLITIGLFGNSNLFNYPVTRKLSESPTIHTFIDPNKLADVHVLELWDEEWKGAGFNTQLLTLEDAKNHPKYDEMKKLIDEHAFENDDATSFYRWMAMSASGGGWISTHYTFPTNFPVDNAQYLPNEGALTSFQAHIPTLVSGNAEEYDRVMGLMLDAILDIPGSKSDEVALHALREEGNHNIHFYYPPDYVQRGFAYDAPGTVDCDAMSKVRAVNIAPEHLVDAKMNGLYPLEESNEVSPILDGKAHQIFLQQWRSQCGGETRPVMHTFFHSVSSMPAEERVLELWKEEWGNAGFDTVVLTLDDAKKHPDFKAVETLMRPLHGKAGYNSLCFYRWFAMAASGGGWMSDHDTLPTNFPIDEGLNLPNGGNFITFQSHVPALMSGTADEWDRVSKLIMDAIPRISDLPGEESKTISDMHALYVLNREGNGSITFVPLGKQVIEGYLYDTPGKVNCDKMSVGRAIHMSHALTHKAVTAGLYPIEVTEEDPVGKETRAEGAKIFMNDWRNQCKGVVAKPVMHTFFLSRSSIEEAVLQLWKDEWTAAGFNPVVLTMGDAEKHPDFNEVKDIMIPLHGETGYDSLCFYRWFAMATAGGGWMSDHDTFPLNFPLELGFKLPNDGTFTSFQRHIPALLSGTKDEWNRVSKLVLDAIPRIEEGGVMSDMYALNVLRNEDNAGILFDEGNRVNSGFLYDAPRTVNCEKAEEVLAVHMAHSSVHGAVDSGLYPLEITTSDPTGTTRRAEASKVFLDDFRAQCKVESGNNWVRLLAT